MDVAGTIIGCVARDKLLDGSRIRVGDQLIAMQSSGLHTNGYSLARKTVFEDLELDCESRPDELEGASVADALLAVHRSYLTQVWPLLEKDLVHGMAHITGGGLPGQPAADPAGRRRGPHRSSRDAAGAGVRLLVNAAQMDVQRPTGYSTWGSASCW